MVNDDGNASIRIEFKKIRRLLFIFVEVEILYVVIDAKLFEGNRGFPAVRGRGGYKVISLIGQVLKIDRESRASGCICSGEHGSKK